MARRSTRATGSWPHRNNSGMATSRITAAHYVENKQRSVLGFGHLLKYERTIIAMDRDVAVS